MDEFDKKLFNDLSEKVEIPIRCEYIIRNAFNIKNTRNNKSIKNILIIIIKTIITICMTTGVVWASTKIYENIWKHPEKVEGYYGEKAEINENTIYGTWHSNDIDISKANAISEDQARAKFSEILNKFGYGSEVITLVELVDNPSDNGLLYRATTKNKFMIEIDAKDTRNFKIFTDIAYKDIDKYRGTQEEIEKVIENICKKYGYDLSKYNHKEVNFNIAQSAFEELLSKDIYISDKPENANIWEVKYNKKYNGIINKYEEISIGLIPQINELYYFIYTDKVPENIDIVVQKEKAKEIALEKENELNIGYNIKNIDIKLDIVKMNGYAYLREKDFQKYYESKTIPLYPLEKLEYYRVEERIRQVWRVKLEFDPTINCTYNENSFTYFIDVLTGEIIGGE